MLYRCKECVSIKVSIVVVAATFFSRSIRTIYCGSTQEHTVNLFMVLYYVILFFFALAVNI